jgi:hypothetical protein
MSLDRLKGYLRNWLSLAGLVIFVGSLFAFVLLFVCSRRTAIPILGFSFMSSRPVLPFWGCASLFSVRWWIDATPTGKHQPPFLTFFISISHGRGTEGFWEDSSRARLVSCC